MKARYIAIGSTIFLVLGIIITIFSFTTAISEATEKFSDGMTPATYVGIKTNPVGTYIIIASAIVLISTGVCSLLCFLKRRIKNEN